MIEEDEAPRLVGVDTLRRGQMASVSALYRDEPDLAPPVQRRDEADGGRTEIANTVEKP